MIQLWEEPFAAAGGIGAKAAQNALGRAHLGRWEVFLRESLQNSWDARRDDEAGIDFRVRIHKLGQAQRDTLRRSLFAQRPSAKREPEFNATLESRDLGLLVVEDCGTFGLAGPTAGDAAVGATGRSDFRDFVMSYGRDEQKGIKGGSFGLGKAALYDASVIRTCIIYSQTHDESGQPVSRLVVVFNGSGFESGHKRFTGRRYWGVVNGMGPLARIEPVTGQAARDLAIGLGLTTLSEQETGTAIGILAPDFLEGETPRSVIEQIREAALKWAWPHMIEQNGHRPIRFTFQVEDDQLADVDPVSDPRYKEFVASYLEALKLRYPGVVETRGYPTSTFSIDMQRPARHLGELALTLCAAKGDQGDDPLSHHVALMRKPRFIVKYLPVAEMPSGQWIRGAFVVSDERDEAFGHAEPPTHDDWIQQVRGSGVRLALDAIRDRAQPKNSAVAVTGAKASPGLVKLAGEMGSLLTGEGLPGSGVSQQPAGKGGGGSSAAKAAEIVAHVGDSSQVRLVDDKPVAEFTVSLSMGAGAALGEWTIEATPRVILPGGFREGKRPVAAALPEVLGWQTGDEFVPGPAIEATRMPRAGAKVLVTMPARSAVSVDVKAVKYA